ncbi:hypothetical protein EDD85DRAFT_784119 [Armillaria nabsnona]|nr:hypothetical protein EDD85DRAFT_784119 [Armillaria nabsnona]
MALTALHIHLSPYALGHLAGFFDKVGSQLISLGWSVPLLDSVPPPLPLNLSKLVRLQQLRVSVHQDYLPAVFPTITSLPASQLENFTLKITTGSDDADVPFAWQSIPRWLGGSGVVGAKHSLRNVDIHIVNRSAFSTHNVRQLSIHGTAHFLRPLLAEGICTISTHPDEDHAWTVMIRHESDIKPVTWKIVEKYFVQKRNHTSIPPNYPVIHTRVARIGEFLDLPTGISPLNPISCCSNVVPEHNSIVPVDPAPDIVECISGLDNVYPLFDV